jgi:hypothetical protein
MRIFRCECDFQNTKVTKMKAKVLALKNKVITLEKNCQHKFALLNNNFACI